MAVSRLDDLRDDDPRHDGWGGNRLPTTPARATAAPAGRALNRRERLAAILERDGGCCIWCGRALQVGLVRATTEHLVPRVKGGPSWLENEVAACRRCNGGRGHRTPADWLAECRGRGWQPDAALLVRTLEALDAAIGERGGQRRARPYIESQLRRLRRMVEPPDER